MTLPAVLARLVCRPGGPFDGDEALQESLASMSLRLGQFAMISSPAPAEVMQAFAGWWRLSGDALEVLRTHGAAALLQSTNPLYRLDDGPHAHVCIATVAPWAPAHTYRTLMRETVALICREPTETISTEFRNRRGRRTWRERRL